MARRPPHKMTTFLGNRVFYFACHMSMRHVYRMPTLGSIYVRLFACRYPFLILPHCAKRANIEVLPLGVRSKNPFSACLHLWDQHALSGSFFKRLTKLVLVVPRHCCIIRFLVSRFRWFRLSCVKSHVIIVRSRFHIKDSSRSTLVRPWSSVSVSFLGSNKSLVLRPSLVMHFRCWLSSHNAR